MASEERAILLRYLNSAGGFTRPPKQLKASFEFASGPQANETSQIFLRAGFQAWLGYFLATNAIKGKSHFSGKADDTRSIAALDKRSYQEKQQVAVDVSKEELSHPIQTRVKLWANLCGYDTCEFLTCPSSRSSCPNKHTVLESTAASANSSSEDRIMADGLNPQSVDLEYGNHLPTSSAPSQEIAIQEDSSNSPDAALVQHMVAATIASVMEVFPQYICGAVLKNHALDGAMIQMAFPRSPSADCVMMLTIQPNKIEYLAMKLFKIHMESEAEQRYLVLQNGSRVVPSSQLTLEGAEEDAIEVILGRPVTDAIQHSLKRILEIRNATQATRCVTMQVDVNPSTPALLNLWLGLEKGIKLGHTLYA
jgi:hypothetical protein